MHTNKSAPMKHKPTKDEFKIANRIVTIIAVLTVAVVITYFLQWPH